MNQTATQPRNRTRTGRNPNPVHLDPDDERLLREIVESPYWAAWQVRRAKVILERAAGVSIKELVQQLGYSRASIQRTCLTYQREGLPGLMTQKQITGGPRKYFVEGSAGSVIPTGHFSISFPTGPELPGASVAGP